MKSPFDQSPTGQPSQSRAPLNAWLVGLGMLLLGLALGVVVNQKDWLPLPAPIVDDDPENVDLEGSYIVRVYETEADKQQEWLVEILNQDRFWFDWINDNGMRYFTFDPDNKDQSTSFIAAAKRQNITPPFWLWAKDGDVLAVQPFRSGDSVESIKRILGQ